MNDLVNIVENTHKEEDVYVRYPDSRVDTLKQLSLRYLSEGVIPFFRNVLKKKIAKAINHETILKTMGEYICKLFFIAEKIDTDLMRSSYYLLKYLHESDKYSKYIES